MLGTAIGNYRITTLLGEGGMGKVYLAEHPTLDRRSAIKVLHAELAADPVVVSRFFVEARAANAIRHPNVVEIFDFGTLPDGAPYLVMEHLEGETLLTRLARGPLTLAEALELAVQIAFGLAALHRKDVVHRDLKPDNLFLVEDPHAPGRTRVKIVDFGIAKLRNRTEPVGHRTRTGALIGTPAYMSPEQCLGLKEVDAQSDVYSLGVILFELCCGQPPFESEGLGALIHMHVSVPPPLPRGLNPQLPAALDSLLLRALGKAPEGRPTMAALHDELTKLLASLPPALRATTALPKPQARTTATTAAVTTLSAGASDRMRTAAGRRGRRVFIGAAALVAAATSAAALLVWPRAPGPGAPPGPAAAAMLALPVAQRKAPGTVDLAAAPLQAPAGDRAGARPAPVDVRLYSDPPGATVSVGGVAIGKTPLVHAAPPGVPLRFVFSLQGHRSEAISAAPLPGLELRAALRRAQRRAPPATPPATPQTVQDDIKSER